MSHLFGAKMNPHLQAASFSRAVHDSFFKGNARLFFPLFLTLLSPSNFHGILGIGGLEPPLAPTLAPQLLATSSWDLWTTMSCQTKRVRAGQE